MVTIKSRHTLTGIERSVERRDTEKQAVLRIAELYRLDEEYGLLGKFYHYYTEVK